MNMTALALASQDGDKRAKVSSRAQRTQSQEATTPPRALSPREARRIHPTKGHPAIPAIPKHGASTVPQMRLPRESTMARGVSTERRGENARGLPACARPVSSPRAGAHGAREGLAHVRSRSCNA